MEFKKLKLIYFSPTGTTQKILQSKASGIGIKDAEHINLTLPNVHQRKLATINADELVILGAPVYGGRLPVDAVNRFKQLKANNTMAVIIVTYGNRDFEDALLELKHLATEIGLNPIAGGTFIGEHSFATKDLSIANGRPDSLDVQKAVEFGEKIKRKMRALQSQLHIDLEIPGRYPYAAGGARSMAVSPVTNEDKCTTCGTCESVCPTAAISINGRVSTKIELCIRCCACIKNCPTGARIIEDSKWKSIATWLNEHCSSRKEPQFFGVD